ncbi:MAG: type II toxin-antitoxin system prevent-host-death family antitoxin [Patescibacteria group bacterium]
MRDTIVGLKELRENAERYISEVKKGKSFIVVRRSKPVFRLSPPDEEDAWERVADFTKIRKGGVPLADLLARM